MILWFFGAERARSTVYNWVHKADLQSENERSPDPVAVDETVVRLNDEQYWLYAAVDSGTNELLHTMLDPTTNTDLAQSFFTKLAEKHDVDDVPRTAVQFSWACKTASLATAVFLVDGLHSLQDAYHQHGVDFRDERHGHRNSVNMSFAR